MTAPAPASWPDASAAGFHGVDESAPEEMDPIDFLARHPEDDAFYFERPSEGLVVATAGRLATSAERPRAERKAGERHPAGGEPCIGRELRVGGFAFDRRGTPRGPWQGFPAMAWDVPRVALTRRDGAWRLHAWATKDEGGEARARALLDETRRRLALVRCEPPPVGALRYGLEPVGSVDEWRRAVETTLTDIEAGHLTKAVLARSARLQANVPWDAWRVARRLRSSQPDATVFAVRRAGKTFLGATPERLVRVRGRLVETAAVAGTASPSERGGVSDAAFLADAKERHEHAIVVEELRRRLEPLACDVSAPPLPRVWSTSGLRHLVTPIAGRLRVGGTLAALCAALHPSPAVAGLPRGRAMDVVRAREGIERGWYAGGVGWADAGGGEVVVPLRAALVEGTRALLYAGAGIVAGSRWEAELEETRLKMRVMLDALVEL